MKVNDLDNVGTYAASHGLAIGRRTLLVEGTSDVALFRLASDLAHAVTGRRLIDSDFVVVAAGERDRGGASGVGRELIALRQFARGVFDEHGRPKYQFAALFDNDRPGNGAMRAAIGLDTAIAENRDVFRLWPQMPVVTMVDPGAITRALAAANPALPNFKWELEDAIAEGFVRDFLQENVSALISETKFAGRTHWELTPDGKSRLHKLVMERATLADLSGVRDVLIALRCYMNAPLK